MAKRLFTSSILISFVLHILMGLGLFLQNKAPTREQTYIEVELQPDINSDLQKQDPLVQKQIVEQEKTLNDESPDKDYYLSLKNQKVLKETRAAEVGAFKNEAGEKTSPASRPTRQQSKAQKMESQPDWMPEEKTSSGLPALNALKPKFEWNQVDEKGSGRQAASQSDDYLKDVEVGRQTMLNTREFLYYTYYNRIKKQLRQYWEPKIKEKFVEAYRRGRKIASENDRVTRVVIVLNKQGVLTGVQVIGPSGVQDLDEAAVDAFRAAAPFPNPPSGLVEKDGQIRIRWDFVLEAA